MSCDGTPGAVVGTCPVVSGLGDTGALASVEGLGVDFVAALGGRLSPHPLSIAKEAEPKRNKASTDEDKRFDKKSEL
jgi:hypothetical protein